MMIKKELPHFKIGLSYGGNQEWFNGFMMKIGGCAAETACDLSVYLDLYKNTHLYPFDIKHITKSDYIKFGSVMKPYLHPRMSGIDKLSIYIDGFGEYLKDNNSEIKISGVEGTEDYQIAEEVLFDRLDNDIPVPFLCLHHIDKRFKDYEWHWFLLNGYMLDGEKLLVKAVSYSSFEWLDFKNLWNTGCSPKGGLIKIEL